MARRERIRADVGVREVQDDGDFAGGSSSLAKNRPGRVVISLGKHLIEKDSGNTNFEN